MHYSCHTAQYPSPVTAVDTAVVKDCRLKSLTPLNLRTYYFRKMGKTEGTGAENCCSSEAHSLISAFTRSTRAKDGSNFGADFGIDYGAWGSFDYAGRSTCPRMSNAEGRAVNGGTRTA